MTDNGYEMTLKILTVKCKKYKKYTINVLSITDSTDLMIKPGLCWDGSIAHIVFAHDETHDFRGALSLLLAATVAHQSESLDGSCAVSLADSEKGLARVTGGLVGLDQILNCEIYKREMFKCFGMQK